MVEYWLLTNLREKLLKIGAEVISHGRYVTFQLADVAVPRILFRKILRRIDDLRPSPGPAWANGTDGKVKTAREVRLNGGMYGQVAFQTPENIQIRSSDGCEDDSILSTVVRGVDFY